MTERERIGEGEASEAGPRGPSPASQTISPHAHQSDAPPRGCLRSRGFLTTHPPVHCDRASCVHTSRGLWASLHGALRARAQCRLRRIQCVCSLVCVLAPKGG